MRFILPSILLILSIASFMLFTNPAYHGDGGPCPSTSTTAPFADCGTEQLKALSDQYNTALTNFQKLEEKRDALKAKYDSISPDSLTQLSKLLPDNTDNIQLIIDLQQMAQSYGMSLSNIQFDATQDAPGASLAATTATTAAASNADYGIFNLEFSTTATYQNFLSFLKDIESSLRLTDIQSIDFSSADPTKSTYLYTVKLQTYWLKAQ